MFKPSHLLADRHGNDKRRRGLAAHAKAASHTVRVENKIKFVVDHTSCRRSTRLYRLPEITKYVKRPRAEQEKTRAEAGQGKEWTRVPFCSGKRSAALTAPPPLRHTRTLFDRRSASGHPVDSAYAFASEFPHERVRDAMTRILRNGIDDAAFHQGWRWQVQLSEQSERGPAGPPSKT